MRPAFYALAPGRLRDWVTVLHPPYTLWHLAYVAIGACLAPHVDVVRLVETLVAFLLALGVAAHALDELRGRPLGTTIPAAALAGAAAASLAGAAAIGIVVAVDSNLWLLAFVAAGVVLVCGYNLELAGMHNDLVFVLAWGAFPVLTGYFAVAETVRVEAVLAAAFAALLSLAQRRLSTQARLLRRQAVAVTGAIELADGTREPLTREWLLAPPEAALRALAAATVALAAALLVLRLA